MFSSIGVLGPRRIKIYPAYPLFWSQIGKEISFSSVNIYRRIATHLIGDNKAFIKRSDEEVIFNSATKSIKIFTYLRLRTWSSQHRKTFAKIYYISDIGYCTSQRQQRISSLNVFHQCLDFYILTEKLTSVHTQYLKL